MENPPLLEAHRGICTRYPENTLTAFQGAAREGYDMIELDMKFTLDGKCIIFHDTTLFRTARRRNGAVIPRETKITELNSNELSEYEVGSWFSPEFAGEPIPTLADAIGFSLDSGIPLKFDNCLFRFHRDLRQGFYNELRKSGITEAGASSAGFTVGTLEAANEVLDEFPHAVIHYDGEITEAALSTLSTSVKEGNLYLWAPLRKMSWLPFPPATAEDVRLMKRYGKVGLWIVDSTEQIEHALSLGADIIETTGCMTKAHL